MAKARHDVPAELLITPDPFTPKFQILVQRDSVTGVAGIYYTENSGIDWRPFLPAPSSKDRIGSVLTIRDGLQVKWCLPPTSVGQSFSGNPIYVEMQQIGQLEEGQVFGYFKVSAGLSFFLTEIQMNLQTTSNRIVSVDVVNGSGLEQGRVAIIRESSRTGSTVLPSPLKLTAGTVWSLKVIQAGTSSPGENLSARLVLRTG